MRTRPCTCRALGSRLRIVVDDGSQNLVGALKTSMGSLGASNIKEMHDVEIIIAHSFQSEGKVFQMSQKVGMGK